MTSIRKFAVGAGTAGLLAAAALLVSAQTGIAAPRSFDDAAIAAPATTLTLSPACAAKIQAIKAAFAADRIEDESERQSVRLEGVSTTDATEDATERANFASLFSDARTACAPAAARPVTTTFTPSAACTSAIQAVKAFLAQGRPTTLAQWQQLQALGRGARTACGWPTTWSWDRR